jgi:hypothetical protein
MKLLFGVKPGRFFMRSTIWIAASHRRECGVSQEVYEILLR